MIHFIDQNEYLSALIDDPRIEGIAASLLGDDFNYEGSDGNYYVGDTRWHSNDYYRKYLTIRSSIWTPSRETLAACGSLPGSYRTGDGFADAVN